MYAPNSCNRCFHSKQDHHEPDPDDDGRQSCMKPYCECRNFVPMDGGR